MSSHASAPSLFVSCVHIKTGMALYSQETIHSINHLSLSVTSSHYGTMLFVCDILDFIINPENTTAYEASSRVDWSSALCFIKYVNC